MKLKNILKLALACIMTTVILSGCYPTGKKTSPTPPVSDGGQNNSSTSNSNSKKTYSATYEYTIPTNFPAQMPKIKIKAMAIDKELVKNVLLRDKTIINEEVQGLYTYINTSDNIRMTLLDDSFFFRDESMEADHKQLSWVSTFYNWNAYMSEEELKNFSRQEAVERIDKLLDEIGIKDYKDPCIIPITPEMANYTLKKTNGRGEEYTLWTENDGAYILKYTLNINGLKVPMADMRTTGITVYNGTIKAVLTKDGIYSITTSYLYEVVSEDEGTVEFNFDADYASNELTDHYSKLLLDDPRFFTECRLEYIPLEHTRDGGVILTPAWCFSGYTLSDPDIPVDYYEFYYVETGIRWGGY